MALTITSRPQVNIGGFNSKWNAAGGKLPVKYSIFSNLFPFSLTAGWNVVLTLSANGYTRMVDTNVTPTAHGYVVGQWIYIASGAYAGISRVISVPSPFSIVIDKPFTAGFSGAVYKYYNNYKINVNVFLDGDLQGTKSYTPSGSTSTVDISDLLKFELDEARVKDFYITVYESYELVRGVTVSTAAVNDSANVFKAVYATLQFQNDFGGNLFQFVIGNNRQAKWMTDFVNPVYFVGSDDWSVSIISDTGVFSLDFEQFDLGGNSLGTDNVAYSDSPGIFEIDFSSITLNANAASVVISGTGVEPITIEIDGTTCN